jgi:hypothetical protein
MSCPRHNRERSIANTAVVAARASHAATGSSCPDLPPGGNGLDAQHDTSTGSSGLVARRVERLHMIAKSKAVRSTFSAIAPSS